jgi:uncharacterized membrane protein HdeD (DUF308 family)
VLSNEEIASEIRQAAKSVGSDLWWLLLVVGVLWLVLALAVLRMTWASVATIGVLIGAVFLASALMELVAVALHASWPLARVLLALLFVGAAVWSFVRPYHAFWALAEAFGFLLVLKGALDITTSVTHQVVNRIWWLGLVTGLLEVALGFWANQQFFPARAVLLLLWVGFYALFRGISEITLAFSVRAAIKTTG